MIARSTPTVGSPQLGFADVFLRLQPQLGELDRFLRSQLSSFEPEIRSAVEYCLEGSGNVSGRRSFFSGWRDAEQIAPPLVRAAAVVEMVHLATLVHATSWTERRAPQPAHRGEAFWRRCRCLAR